jgi:two-component system, chemotaxis family, chemotaxis protein CheY
MRPAVPAGGSGTILVVDDDETLRWVLFWVLTDEGYSVMEAPDGAVALARVHEATPSLILLDMRMPVLDGWEFARRYRALPGPHAPIICVTAAASAEDVATRAAQIGAAASLSKPFNLDELLALVGRYVPLPAAETP